jgi:hypothetical protein
MLIITWSFKLIFKPYRASSKLVQLYEVVLNFFLFLFGEFIYKKFIIKVMVLPTIKLITLMWAAAAQLQSKPNTGKSQGRAGSGAYVKPKYKLTAYTVRQIKKEQKQIHLDSCSVNLSTKPIGVLFYYFISCWESKTQIPSGYIIKLGVVIGRDLKLSNGH